eukprot:3428556-Pyramimonas_sp.AAC.1
MLCHKPVRRPLQRLRWAAAVLLQHAAPVEELDHPPHHAPPIVPRGRAIALRATAQGLLAAKCA